MARVEDALHATRAAVAEGIVPGGGVSFIRALPALDRIRKQLKANERVGLDVVAEALTVPTRAIADNAGEKGSVVVAKVSEMTGNKGFNALTLKYTDLIADGVITPAKVDRTALQNAASVARLLLTTDCIVTEAPTDDSNGPGGAPGMDEMGGMGGGMGGMGGMPGMGGMGF